MTAGDGFPPHPGEPVPPAPEVPAVPGAPVPSWPQEWASPEYPSEQPPVMDTGAVDDGWQPTEPVSVVESEPVAGSWFTPLTEQPLSAPIPSAPAVPPPDPFPPVADPFVSPQDPFAPAGDLFVSPQAPSASPQEPAAFPQGPALPPPGPFTSLPGPSLPPGPSSRSPRQAVRRLRPAGRRAWWMLPFVCGLAMVIAIAAVVLVTVVRQSSSGSHRTSSARTGSARTGKPAVTTKQMPSVMVPDALLGDLTRDLQSGNEAGFLSLVAPGARPSVRIWWENQQAIGYTTGVVLPMAAGGKVSVDRQGDGTTTILAGTHSQLDPLDGNGKPSIPSELYRIGLHFASPTATGQITSWTALGNAPWDQGTVLYVRRAAHVVVAGPAGDSTFVNQALPLAETAARYDIGLLNRGSRHELPQGGFIVFVEPEGATWFDAGPQPQGWPGAFHGGRTVPLPGAGLSGNSAAVAANISDGVVGGARVLVTPFEQDHETARGETQTLVRDFMLDALAPDNGEQALRSVPSWSLEGIGIMAQALYAANPNPAPKSYNFAPLENALRKLPRRYRSGHLPTSGQLFGGSPGTQQDWNDVAASVYAYIGRTYGVNRMLASAVLLYAHQSTPFGNVVAPRKKAASGFFGRHTIEGEWRVALARL